MKLSPEVLSEVKRVLSLVRHHQEIAAVLERSIRNLIEKECGVDLDSDNWQLDLDAGELKHAAGE
jgi:hypothetical protein